MRGYKQTKDMIINRSDTEAAWPLSSPTGGISVDYGDTFVSIYTAQPNLSILLESGRFYILVLGYKTHPATTDLQ